MKKSNVRAIKQDQPFEPPAELQDKISEAEATYKSLTAYRQRLQQQAMDLQREQQRTEMEVVAAAGFLGTIYQTYPALPQIPGILSKEK